MVDVAYAADFISSVGVMVGFDYRYIYVSFDQKNFANRDRGLKQGILSIYIEMYSYYVN